MINKIGAMRRPKPITTCDLRKRIVEKKPIIESGYVGNNEPTRISEFNEHFSRPISPTLPQHSFQHVNYDLILTYKGFTRDLNIAEKDQYVIHHFIIRYFTLDGKIEISKPKIVNSGFQHGLYLRKTLVINPCTNRPYRPRDLIIGNIICVGGRQILIYWCDAFTRDHLHREYGVEMKENMDESNLPIDEYVKYRVHYMDDIAQPLRPYHSFDKLAPFLKYDRQVLKFWAVWDDSESMFGDVRRFILLYFLSDKSIEIRELLPINSGRAETTLFVKRQPLPKDVLPVPQPGKETSKSVLNAFGGSNVSRFLFDNLNVGYDPINYYEDKDLMIGELIYVYNRPFLLVDCDQFTRNFYLTKYGINDMEPVDYDRLVHQRQKDERKRIKDEKRNRRRAANPEKYLRREKEKERRERLEEEERKLMINADETVEEKKRREKREREKKKKERAKRYEKRIMKRNLMRMKHIQQSSSSSNSSSSSSSSSEEEDEEQVIEVEDGNGGLQVMRRKVKKSKKDKTVGCNRYVRMNAYKAMYKDVDPDELIKFGWVKEPQFGDSDDEDFTTHKNPNLQLMNRYTFDRLYLDELQDKYETESLRYRIRLVDPVEKSDAEKRFILNYYPKDHTISVIEIPDKKSFSGFDTAKHLNRDRYRLPIIKRYITLADIIIGNEINLRGIPYKIFDADEKTYDILEELKFPLSHVPTILGRMHLQPLNQRRDKFTSIFHECDITCSGYVTYRSFRCLLERFIPTITQQEIDTLARHYRYVDHIPLNGREIIIEVQRQLKQQNYDSLEELKLNFLHRDHLMIGRLPFEEVRNAIISTHCLLPIPLIDKFLNFMKRENDAIDYFDILRSFNWKTYAVSSLNADYSAIDEMLQGRNILETKEEKCDSIYCEQSGLAVNYRRFLNDLFATKRLHLPLADVDPDDKKYQNRK